MVEGDEYGVRQRVQRHSAQIGARTVSVWRLTQLKNSVMAEAKLSFEEQNNAEAALDGFAHCLAIEESTFWRDHAFTAAVEYNIGACLHCMREFDHAIVCRHAPSLSEPFIDYAGQPGCVPTQCARLPYWPALSPVPRYGTSGRSTCSTQIDLVGLDR